MSDPTPAAATVAKLGAAATALSIPLLHWYAGIVLGAWAGVVLAATEPGRRSPLRGWRSVVYRSIMGVVFTGPIALRQDPDPSRWTVSGLATLACLVAWWGPDLARAAREVALQRVKNWKGGSE